MRFWDSSALVPLVVGQPASSETERWLADDAVLVVWTLSFVEVVSALRRLVRDQMLPERAARDAENLATELVSRAHVVADVERVKVLAARLLRVHPLRAADALQLGAALLWSDGRADQAILHTFDRRLGEAASREGLRVLPDV